MPHRIVVVEDYEDTRDIVRTVLTHYGYEVVEALSGEELLARVDALRPDLIILDLRLPGMDGCEALEKLRAAGHRVPVFFFSDYYDFYRERIHSCRPDAFFPKSKGPIGMIAAVTQKLPPAAPA
ncbi:MAG: response regulator [Gemmatimonadota bacterium]